MKEKLLKLLKRFSSFIKYSVSSIISFLLDYGIFTLLNAVILSGMAAGGREFIATYGARIVSATVNFLLNRKVVFNVTENTGRSAVRYLILAVLQACASAGLVTLLHRLLGTAALAETLIKIPVDAMLFLLSYQIQKRWVFAPSKDAGTKKDAE